MKTILLIEDNSSILENLAEYLELEGYKILVTNSGKRGVELAREFLPDLIICDVLMPKMNGHEVLHLLLETDKTSEIPFIFSTSMSEKIDKAEALKHGADEYIVKPFEVEALLEVVKRCMKCGSKRHSCTFKRLQISLIGLGMNVLPYCEITMENKEITVVAKTVN